jgi:Kelch motif.
VRQWHTATLLPNGKVLVAGGYDGDAHSLTELYDPATGTWTNTGAMTISRYLHRATLLPNGKVLVTGGFDSSFHPTNSAELYDSTTGTWTNTSPMMATHAWHTATLLPNGKVLVAGGATNISEIYDPAIETWTATDSITTNRTYPTATLLTNGNVLLSGGSPNLGFSVLSSTELYDSSNMTVTAFNLINSTNLPSRTFQFSFTNALNESFSVLGTTNLSLPLSSWTVMGGVTEFPPGRYQFTDPQATNSPQRFYRVRSP